MPKQTLLEVVKIIAEQINSDEVTTLDEGSIEIDDITKISLRVLEDIISRNDWEFLRDRPLQLLAGTNVIELAIPDTVQTVQTVRYRYVDDGIQSGFRTLTYMTPAKFMERLQDNRPTEPDTDLVTLSSGVELYPRTNRQPRYWTSFDEKNVVLDSYDKAQNPSGIIPADSAILATVYLDFTGSETGAVDRDNWVAPIPEKLFPLWLQESSAECSVLLRQAENPREERKARRSYVQQIRREPVTNKDEGSQEVNYGR